MTEQMCYNKDKEQMFIIIAKEGIADETVLQYKRKCSENTSAAKK